ncbi:hypothetical protein M408DRAFT_185827 [Serendipita vermifera MAFF 305830]|uniref:Uncharacterized protein n=1 Tax=Serendipita vermifera MAFF 305830 TaxID=933852 RepID=A0A0C2X3F1_SERVB|nr:hypothetical protein M408DRAFT_185827 [Serendipita vermifera MAFF 305830]
MKETNKTSIMTGSIRDKSAKQNNQKKGRAGIEIGGFRLVFVTPRILGRVGTKKRRGKWYRQRQQEMRNCITKVVARFDL